MPESKIEQADILTSQGLAHARDQRLEQAIEAFHRAIALQPGFAKAHHNLGVALAQQGKPRAAIESLREAIRLVPEYAEAYYNLGNVLGQLHRHGESIEAYRHALRYKPEHTDALNNLGLALALHGSPEEAVVLLRQALRLRPTFQEALNNLGLALTEFGAFREAEACLERALAADPRYVEAHANLGNLYKEEERPEAALACYDLALRYQPQSVSTRWNRSLALLQTGDYQRGWAEYEWRLRKPDCGVRPLAQPAWDGTPHPGTLLVHMEQGQGDMLQFIRLVPLAKKLVGKTIVTCPGSLRALFAQSSVADVVLDECDALPVFDMQVPLLSLPRLLQMTLDTIPRTPYLQANVQQGGIWRERLAHLPGFKIGICWQGNPKYRKDRRRSVSLRQFECLAQVAGIHLICLQRGFGTEQLQQPRGRFEVFDPWLGSERLGDWDETAALIQQLDLVISVDTAVAHLAGALGVPTWIMLPTSPDWRWLLQRDDSPWYPTMRLFRQTEAGNWNRVFEDMRLAFQQLEMSLARSDKH